jgi:hypothetical protein
VEAALFLVRCQTSLTGKAKRRSTIPFEREAEESRNFKLRMIDRFKTKASMTTEDANSRREHFVSGVAVNYLLSSDF